ncbi:helix-turn-helix transcriptional regulator [Roseimicrobium sp. ORNL1]|uniref:helix-turn-helix transcriptional regulator n=1 Tax=Roseimicrobium sp. ORNL1 TaxID=2711231 RepID=UPI0013E19558|nr:helix-turn-helix transcriptional regulator [Roseimicrobium sp. ORNL1]QIF01381.1 hypothetical protein G5S37_07555 [Roseimicrobium sp. ORNL1]
MQRVSHLDLKAVKQCSHDLLEASSHEDLRDRLIFGWLPKLIDSDFTACNEFSQGRVLKITSTVNNAEINKYAEPFGALIHQHPCFKLQSELGITTPLKISDFITQRELHDLGLYQEVYKYLGIERQMALSVHPAPGELVSMVLSSSTRDYTERDRVVLSLLQPAIQRAFAVMRHRTLFASLSSREAEVLSWVAEAKTNKEIALILGISARTVQKHLETIFTKLGVETRTAAALWARQLASSVPK